MNNLHEDYFKVFALGGSNMKKIHLFPEYVGLPLKDFHYINLSVGGLTLAENAPYYKNGVEKAKYIIDNQLNLRTDFLIFCPQLNNFSNSISHMEGFANRIKEIIEHAQQINASERLIIMSPFYRKNDQYDYYIHYLNEKLEGICNENAVNFISPLKYFDKFDPRMFIDFPNNCHYSPPIIFHMRDLIAKLLNDKIQKQISGNIQFLEENLAQMDF